jgi:glycosyltransferase involved in cell wall biosynthesis
MTVTMASAYQEGSIRAIAVGADRKGVLHCFYTTYAIGRAEVFNRIPVVGRAISRELGRRSFSGISQDRIATVAKIPELLHVVLRRLLAGHANVPGLMYWVKSRFDSAVARALERNGADIVIGMWGSSLETFKAAGPNCIKVLNYVNSRPEYHNRFLRELAQLRPGHPEMVPLRTSESVEREMAIADLLLVPSEFVAAQMPEYRDKVAIVPYGVDPVAFSRHEKPNSSECNVIFVGQISHRKGISTLLAAARRLPKISIRMVGPVVSPELLESLPSNVIYEGSALHQDVSSAMRSADLFVLPSLEDSYGLVTLEAMAAGVPVVVSRNCGTSELISHGESGMLFPAGDTSALVAAIDELVSSAELRARIGRAGQRKVLKGFTWEQYSDRVLQHIAAITVGATT